MSDTELLLKKVEGLSPAYMAQIFNFIDQLTYKVNPAQESSNTNRYKAIDDLEGLGKRMGSTLTVDRFLEIRHEETEYEEQV
ncbi:hypothetical protein ACYULU_02345 [Breznakiellaceae bacterium SP9]